MLWSIASHIIKAKQSRTEETPLSTRFRLGEKQPKNVGPTPERLLQECVELLTTVGLDLYELNVWPIYRHDVASVLRGRRFSNSPLFAVPVMNNDGD